MLQLFKIYAIIGFFDSSMSSPPFYLFVYLPLGDWNHSLQNRFMSEYGSI